MPGAVLKRAGVKDRKTPKAAIRHGQIPDDKKPGTRPAKETGGRGGLDPTRYGDWEKNGRAIDF